MCDKKKKKKLSKEHVTSHLHGFQNPSLMFSRSNKRAHMIFLLFLIFVAVGEIIGFNLATLS